MTYFMLGELMDALIGYRAPVTRTQSVVKGFPIWQRWQQAAGTPATCTMLHAGVLLAHPAPHPIRPHTSLGIQVDHFFF